MLIPQYSLRWLLGATTVCAVICSIFAIAMRGSLLAAAVSMAIVALVAAVTFYVLFFALVWIVSLVFTPPSSTTNKKPDAKPDGTLLVALILAVLPPLCGGSRALAQSLVGNGLTMDIGFGNRMGRPAYRPVRISVRPNGPVTADRTLSIEILIGRRGAPTVMICT